MEHPNCSECERLLVRYREATKVWAEVNKEFAESALKYEAAMFSPVLDALFSHVLDKCHLALSLCKEAGQDFREHLRATRCTILP